MRLTIRNPSLTSLHSIELDEFLIDLYEDSLVFLLALSVHPVLLEEQPTCIAKVVSLRIFPPERGVDAFAVRAADQVSVVQVLVVHLHDLGPVWVRHFHGNAVHDLFILLQL